MEEEFSNAPDSEDMDEDETVEDLATDNQARIDALIELLTKRGLITDQEFEHHYNEQFSDDDDADEGDEPEEPQPSPEPVQQPSQ